MQDEPADSNLVDFLENINLDNSLIAGYFGGGNFGDELLLEVFLNLISKKKVEINNTYIYYLNKEWFKDYHTQANHKYQVVDAQNIKQVLMVYMRSKNIVIAGGGLWGLDFNLKAMVLSIALFLGRFIFRKKIYMLGVGFYGSTNIYGKVGAWLAGKAANNIYARDHETFNNFVKWFGNKVVLDRDLSSYLYLIDANIYKKDLEIVEQKFKINSKIILLCVRNFKAGLNAHYRDVIQVFVENNTDKRIILAILEPKETNPSGFSFIKTLAAGKPNIDIVDFRFNPIAWHLFLRKNNLDIILIAPHYHALAVGILNNIKFLPIVYDNKSEQLLIEKNLSNYYNIDQLSPRILQKFIDNEL